MLLMELSGRRTFDSIGVHVPLGVWMVFVPSGIVDIFSLTKETCGNMNKGSSSYLHIYSVGANPGTEYKPQWMKIPNLESFHHIGASCFERLARLGS